MKNIIILGFLTVVTLSYASEPIEPESMELEESFKVEKAVEEKVGARAFAGAKAKKETAEENTEDAPAKTDDEAVKFWKYQE